MPVFVEDPAQFSKPRLKSELIAHNVTLPAVESKKQVYVELYLKHIVQKSAADFSSDEEDDDVVEVQDSQDFEEEKDPEMLDPSVLTDDELKTTLLKYGVEAGPIVATTRSIYERKLQRLLKPAQPRQNGGTGDADQYSDSEGEEESGSQQGSPETVSLMEENLHVDMREPVTDVLMEMFPETEPTPTGIAATRRRPIKGAAGRPVQFKYPDLPASPMTLQRWAVEHRLVPLWVQILVFFIVACLLYLIYAAIEDSLANPFVALLDNLSMETETEGLSLQAEP
ncbi:LEM domain-containing protein 1 isoform 4-T6 [Salvelinus alpinus]|uniref:Lamina-associated polypeptide 2, isoforms beta/gamma-like n=1 Tax=Salvelinus namaycush TaxID=8040 RepID=A0A8U1C8H5_SALNM|nr:lamina-associated polypeptide 2, isoforms beta/gamma isoform X9 [Salvelinus alpinus]XP_038864004.1 lamina-associated polypeptide 2, isoforms beta/gamma-like [Salvelinus namaycush]